MVERIYVVRHGFRMNWQGNETFPITGRPRDPVLTAHGLDQARCLAQYFLSLPEAEQPQLVISSRYYRCMQTAFPTAKALGLQLLPEPGLSEWFPPAWPPDSGKHPFPPSVEDLEEQFPPNAISRTWRPLLYASPQGETAEQLHKRTKRFLSLLEARCEQIGVKRVLLCSHAATIIALGRSILAESAGTDGRGYPIGAGTASLSLYVRGEQGGDAGRWTQLLNGSADHLPEGVEREWNFDHVPSNVTEPGMGADWVDSAQPLLEDKADTVWMEDEQDPYREDAGPTFEGAKL
ncbi:phosphoglycerate mutase-like protein [Tilletiaria anomala UBC 951]|uniref:Phosphoglycerate mutase-like protein n=1 Tax=Tilletiaria anomala (strain ATCC 24038 / CBS 436.72 / UBC 951) TaxID=1037660 RepID=A0A066VU17_TILAU|nr:phosphoglycerate mutase-like protein [Tilletiaria anomala UBC 951]KDN42294.1 phosphoglycerate mutase-like protein [Tilletiaria anomala UBC 951]